MRVKKKKRERIKECNILFKTRLLYDGMVPHGHPSLAIGTHFYPYIQSVYSSIGSNITKLLIATLLHQG